MFYFLSKTLDLLLEPWWWAMALLAVAFMLRRKRRWPQAAAALALSILVVFSLPATAAVLWHRLEAEATALPRPAGQFDALVVLGGALDVSGSEVDAVSWNDNQERLSVAIELMRERRASKVIVSGASGAHWLPSEAELLSQALQKSGVSKDDVLLEPEALNTEQNAQQVAKILEANGLKTVLVITSAYHLPRTQDCFSQVHIDAQYWPVDFRMRRPEGEMMKLPRARYLTESTEAIREFAGRVVYAIKHHR